MIRDLWITPLTIIIMTLSSSVFGYFNSIFIHEITLWDLYVPYTIKLFEYQFGSYLQTPIVIWDPWILWVIPNHKLSFLYRLPLLIYIFPYYHYAKRILEYTQEVHHLRNDAIRSMGSSIMFYIINFTKKWCVHHHEI